MVVLVALGACGAPRVHITPATVPPYADCSGESPVDPCVRPSTDLGLNSHDTPPP